MNLLYELYYASKTNDVTTLRELTRENPSLLISARQYGETLLFPASLEGACETIDFLISAGVDVNEANKEGERPLHFAVSGKKLKAVEMLLNLNANPNVFSNRGNSPLSMAVFDYQDDLSFVRALLRHGADLRIGDPMHGITPIALAEKMSKTMLVNYLKSVASGLREP